MIFPFRRLALGLGLTAAGGLAVWSSFQKPAAGLPAKPAEQARATDVPRGADGPVKPKPLRARRTPAEIPSPDATGEIEIATPVPFESRAPVAFEPTREELELRALIVERQASKQLKTLLGVLDLSESQQDRIFSALARHSDYYHPALQFQNSTGEPIAALPVAKLTPATPGTQERPSTPPPDPTVDPILVELDPDQVEVYERYRSERDAFWAGVVDDVEKQLNTNGE